MRKLFCIVVLCVAAAAAFGEEAAVIPEQNMRLSQNEDFGFADDEFMHSWGLGAEYGIRDWLNVQLLWNRYLKLMPDLGSGSAFLGAKVYIVGDDALLKTNEKFRLSLALGVLAPASGEQPDFFDQDQNLWGTVFRVYGDFIVSRYVYINAFYEWDFYPPQYQNDNVEAYRDWVRHYQDYTLEIEGHFQIPLENGFILKGGVPFRFFCAPYMNASDGLATSQYFITTGAYFGIQFPEHSPPVEVYLRYTVPLIGQNFKQIHRISLIHKVTLPPELLKMRLKGRTPKAGEGYTFTENENE
jgi:hypothetical protein